MGAKLYKYAGPDAVAKAFSVPGACTLRCSYPKDFNDPYELFLVIDYDQDPGVLAYYRETIGQIPQIATTCFSKSPEVVPMWAHYARNHEGIVIEVDEDKVLETFPNTAFGDVDYREGADTNILSLLHHAQTTCKPRHVYLFQRAVFSAAYYTKHTCWSYEQERRVLANAENVDQADGMLLFRAPVQSVTAIIVGHRATAETKSTVKNVVAQLGCKSLEMRIGRSSLKPYFVESAGGLWVFNDGQMAKCGNSCAACGEPVRQGENTCPWCSIHQEHDIDAARRNPMRMLSRYGLLEDYYKSMEEIRRKSET